MTHDPRDRVEVLRDGAHVTWARRAVTIAGEALRGALAVRGTMSALSAAGVRIGDDGRATVEHAGESHAVGVVVSPVSLAPRPSGKSESTAPRKRPKRAITLSPAAWAWLDAQAGEGGVSAVVERLAAAANRGPVDLFSRIVTRGLRVGRPARIVSLVGAVRRLAERTQMTITAPSVESFLATPAAKKAARKLAAASKAASVARQKQGAAQEEMDRMIREYMAGNGIARPAEPWRPQPPPAGWLQNERPAPAKEPAFLLCNATEAPQRGTERQKPRTPLPQAPRRVT